MPHVAPYGSWKSPITSDLIVSRSIGLSAILPDGQDTYWGEGRPSEGGRIAIVRRTPDGTTTDIIPPPFNARSRVHEYGGGSFVVENGSIYFSNFADNRLYYMRPGSEPQPITPEAPLRYADMIVDRRRNRLICVREDHTTSSREAVNTLVSITLEGDVQGGTIVVSGNDFYSSPRLSPDGSRLAWLTWNHPNMPWDGTELWVGELDAAGFVTRETRVAGGLTESISQPEWSPAGVLHFISDRTGWWNLYRLHNGEVQALCKKDAEFSGPQWVFGLSTYQFVSASHVEDPSLICWYGEEGIGHLAHLNTSTGELSPIETPYTAIGSVKVAPGRLLFLGASPTEPWSAVQIDIETAKMEVFRRSSSVEIAPAYFSQPEPLEFPTEHGLLAYAFYYPPRNPDYMTPTSELPPLLVLSHGGPTAETSSALNLGIQYWTSRGFAVLDVNYGGSTGYGRAYRERLNGQWGIVDVDDCSNGAKYLAERGLVDGNRLAIRGGSAGGYTTLAALTFRDTFQAGASYFGVSDLEALAIDTHKFESRYMDSMVGPYPEKRDLYHQRSPINHTDRLSRPVIFFQGLEDRIVPPSQAERMVEALRKKHIPVAYLPFEGEGHGFRRAENIKRSLEAELSFYARMFGFELADPVEPVVIENVGEVPLQPRGS